MYQFIISKVEKMLVLDSITLSLNLIVNFINFEQFRWTKIIKINNEIQR